MIRRYRKRPVEISAVQWDGTNLDEVADLIGATRDGDGYDELYTARRRARGDAVYVVLTTAQGQQVPAAPGEWVVPETEPGRGYPVAADVFAATYDEITED